MAEEARVLRTDTTATMHVSERTDSEDVSSMSVMRLEGCIIEKSRGWGIPKRRPRERAGRKYLGLGPGRGTRKTDQQRGSVGKKTWARMWKLEIGRQWRGSVGLPIMKTVLTVRESRKKERAREDMRPNSKDVSSLSRTERLDSEEVSPKQWNERLNSIEVSSTWLRQRLVSEDVLKTSCSKCFWARERLRSNLRDRGTEQLKAITLLDSPERKCLR